ncbi:AfsR family transcriptional regulator [Actinomadura craniellae]|uniref:AfsR family transcriptional regulator n=1 Tax=Actinomadura craniellae TaxID=2231787 RepID=A0A365GVT7_9ACTN|nr:BTAD domain-containing putative transcriptional regulator [Actinomadura craniellae]RAY10910.1 AfsR family transcriptional regulator [Actinomadura craniellae]
MRIGILGPLEVRADGRPVEIGGPRLRALLTLLALRADRPVPAEQLIDDLWAGDPPAGAANALQSLVSRLRALLGRDRVASTAGGYRLAVPPAAVDAFDFETRVERSRTSADPATTADGLRAALGLWRGPALADAADLPCAAAPIARLDGLRRAALDRRIEADLALGRHTELIPELSALVTADPLREPPRGQLMRALRAAGRRAEALAVYEETRRSLADALGADPSPELRAVHLSLLRDEEPVPPPADAPGPRPRRTSFVGREDEIDRIVGLLAETRLVTLTGPGGAGKTRLSLESVDRLAGRSPDGVHLVELAPLTDPAEVPYAALTALGLRDAPPVPAPRGRSAEGPGPLARLAGALATRRALLLLDNCEHLVDAAADLADRLLAACPGVRILATSREPLAVPGEALWPVEPLPSPPEGADAAAALRSPAVRLLADRAAAVQPGFAVTDANAAAVTAICRALDGMPLAIELAAARLRAFTPAQLAGRLDDRFRLLTGGSRTALPRHRTLRATVEWSWDLLDPAEQVLWRRLSLFSGGATVAAIEAVCAGPGLPAADVLATLAALVDKSLVTVTGDAEPAEEPRYRMLETLRAYGLDRAQAAGDLDRTRRAHTAHFTALAEAAEPRLRGPEQLAWLDRLSAEHDNLHGALRRSLAAGDTAAAVRLVAALGWYWLLRGHLTEGGELADATLARPDLGADRATALAYMVSALTAIEGTGRFDRAGDWLRAAQEVVESLDGAAGTSHPLLRLLEPLCLIYEAGGWRRTGQALVPLFEDPDVWVRAFSRLLYGLAMINEGLAEEAEAHYTAARERFLALGERWGLAFALSSLAEVASWRGERRTAVDLYTESSRLLTELGTRENSPHIHVRNAYELWLLGERDRALALVESVRASAERTGSIEALAGAEYAYGEFARRLGDLTEAGRRFDRALELVGGTDGRPHAPPQFRAIIISAQGLLDAGRGDLERARARHAEAMRAAIASEDSPVVAQTVVGFADLAMRAGDPAECAELLGCSDALRGMPDRSSPDAVRLAEEARAALGPDGYAAAYARGRATASEDVPARLGVECPADRPAPTAAGPDPGRAKR